MHRTPYPQMNDDVFTFGPLERGPLKKISKPGSTTLLLGFEDSLDPKSAAIAARSHAAIIEADIVADISIPHGAFGLRVGVIGAALISPIETIIVTDGSPLNFAITARRSGIRLNIHFSRALFGYVDFILRRWVEREGLPAPANEANATPYCTSNAGADRAAVYMQIAKSGMDWDISTSGIAAAREMGFRRVLLFADPELSLTQYRSDGLLYLRRRIAAGQFRTILFADGNAPSLSLTIERIVMRAYARGGVSFLSSEASRWRPRSELSELMRSWPMPPKMSVSNGRETAGAEQ